MLTQRQEDQYKNNFYYFPMNIIKINDKYINLIVYNKLINI